MDYKWEDSTSAVPMGLVGAKSHWSFINRSIFILCLCMCEDNDWARLVCQYAHVLPRTQLEFDIRFMEVDNERARKKSVS